MTYTTQMNAARAGIATKEMETVAAYEGMDLQKLMREVAAGTIVIPANKNHKCLKPFGIGNSLKTKINVNLGTSRDCLNLDVEMKKVNQAVSMGAEAIMDLSSFGDTQTFRRKLVAECPAILGTVPIYDAIVYYNKALKDITSREWIDIFKMHAEDGVDFMTIHCGINRSTADRFKAMKRQMNIVSRGGSLIFAFSGSKARSNWVFQSSFCLASAIWLSQSMAPFMPLAISAAWAAIFEAIMPSFTSSTFGRRRCSAGVT